MFPKPRLSLLWLLLLALLPLFPGDSPASNPNVPGAPTWIPWEAVKLPSITLVRSHSNPPGIAPGQQFKAYCNFVDGTYRPGYLLGNPKPGLLPWKWITSPTGHTSLATAATSTAAQVGQRVWVEANGEYANPPGSVNSAGEPVTSGPRIPVRFAKWVDMGVTQTFTDTNQDGISDDWARHYGVKSANDLFQEMEGSGTYVNPSGDFTAGYLYGTTFTAFSSSQHIQNFGNIQGANGFVWSNWIPLVLQNTKDVPLAVGAAQNLAPKQFWLHPGQTPGVKAVLRFTAPSSGGYHFGCAFNALNMSGPAGRNGMDVAVVKGTPSGASTLQSASIGIGFTAASASWASSITLAAGDTLDFTVDSRNDWDLDSTGLFVTVSKEDTDGDGLTDLLEFKNSTDPNVQDTDGDGVGDNIEVLAGLNPLDSKDVAADWDGDGVPNGVEAVLRMEAATIDPPVSWAWLVPQLLQLDPATSRDSDADGVSDDYETVFGLPTAVPVAVFSAGESMAARENSGTPSNTFGPFQTGMGSGSGFTIFTQHTGGGGFYNGDSFLRGYTQTGTDTFPAVTVNLSSNPIGPWYFDKDRPLAPHQLMLHPHDTGPDATLRFIAPADGKYSFCSRFDSLNHQAGGVDVYVRKGSGSTLLFSKKIGGANQRAATFGSVLTLAAGETLDFSVGPNGRRDADSTGVTITCFQLQPPPDRLTSVTYDANTTFRASEQGVPPNPFGLFQAGYNTAGTGFTPFTQAQHTAFDGSSKYKGFSATAQGYPLVYVNPSATTAISGAPFSATVQPGQIVLHPGSDRAILRFVAPEGGNYSFSADFQRLVTDATTTDAHSVEASVLTGQSPTPLKSAKIGAGTSNPQSAVLSGSCLLLAGETLDFTVGPDGGNNYDATGLTLKVTRLSGNADSDGDGLPDFAEAQARTWAATPASWRYPVTGFPMGYSTTDESRNGIPDIFEPPYAFAAAGYTPESGSAPASFTMPDPRDTDADSAWDGQEILSGSDPLNPDDLHYFVGGSGSGGTTNPSFFDSGYVTSSGDAFQWGRLAPSQSNPMFTIWGQKGSGGNNDFQLPDQSVPRLLLSYLSNEHNENMWDPWFESIFLGVSAVFSRNIEFIAEGATVKLNELEEDFSGFKSKLTGGDLEGRVVVDFIHESESIVTNDENDGGIPWGRNAIRYEPSRPMRHLFQASRMSRPADTPFHSGASGIYNWTSGSDSHIFEFYFGTGDLWNQAQHNALGIPYVSSGGYAGMSIEFGLRVPLITDFVGGTAYGLGAC